MALQVSSVTVEQAEEGRVGASEEEADECWVVSRRAIFWKRSSNFVDIVNWVVVSLAMAFCSQSRLDLERVNSAMEALNESTNC